MGECITLEDLSRALGCMSKDELKEVSELDDTNAFRRFLYQGMKCNTHFLECYAKCDGLGQYQRLAQTLLSFSRGQGIDLGELSRKEVEWWGIEIVDAIALMYGQGVCIELFRLRNYLSKLFDLLNYLDYQDPYWTLFHGIDLKNMDKKLVLTNFLTDGVTNSAWIFMLYVNGVSAGVFLPMNCWEQFKRVMIARADFRTTPEEARTLYDFNLLEDYQVEFLLELGYEDEELLKYALSKNLRVPSFYKGIRQEGSISNSVRDINTIEDAVKAWPTKLSLEQKQYLYQKLQGSNGKEVTLGDLPVTIPLFNLALIRAGITELGLRGKP